MIPTGSGKSSSIDASNGRAVVLGPGGKSRPVRLRFRWDGLFKLGTLLCGLTASILILWIGYQLYSVSALSREKFGWHLLTNSKWDETREIYGALPYIYGSVLTAILALIIAVPLAVGCAVFLTQYAPRWLAVPVAFFLDLLAAVPSIIFGLWGILVVCPWMQAHINHWLVDHFGSVPFFAGPALSFTNVLAAGVILALMILPFITAVSREVLLAIPPGFREASMGLGATRWETIKLAVLPASASGIIGAAMLGLGRAVGETMAVVMVIGNTPQIKLSLLQPGESMTALLANKFNEAFSDPMQLSALLEIALILFVFTFILNAIARLLIRLTSKVGTKGEPAVWIQTSKASLGFAFRYGVTAALILLVLVQAVSDVKRSGPVGLFGPFEVLAVAYVGIRFAEVRLCGTKNWDRFRKANDFTMRALCALTSVMACTGLFLLLAYVTKNGVHGVNVALFTQDPRPADMAGGGLRPAILGTMTVVALACLIGIPVGVMGGIYLSEYPESRLGSPMRFAADVLNGIPSVVIGMFAYAAFVLPVKHFSAIAGGAALGIMMIPTVIRVTDEMMRLVPSGIREASLGLGASRMQTTLKVILPAARKGVVIGILLAIARVSGETAPLLFTAFGSDHVTTNLREPISTLTLKIFQYAQSAQDNWISQAWAGAFVLLLMIFVISLAARLATRNKFV